MPELKPLVLNPPLNVTHVRDQAGLDQLADFFQRTKGTAIGFDIETNPLKDYFYRRTRTWQFGNQKEQYTIDLRAFCGDSADNLFKAQGYYGLNVPDSLKPVLDLCRPVLCTRDWLKCGVNLGFEYQNTYWQFGMRIQHLYDCGMSERCIWAGALGSMKQYAFFSMEQMMARYFCAQIDKSLQESFNLDVTLSPEQVVYAALDTRYPLAIRAVQMLILQGETPATLRAKKMPGAAAQLERLNPVILGDNLTEIAQIENNAIGAFEDMTIHGERIDRTRWLERIARKKIEFKSVINDELDPIFLPIVGNKNDQITDEQIAASEAAWKAFNVVPPEEVALTAQWRLAARRDKTTKELIDPVALAAFEAEHTVIEVNSKGAEKRILKLAAIRKERKEEMKKVTSELGKKRTKIKNLAAKCAGNALINYESGAQLLNVLRGMRGLKTLEDTEDETLEKYEHIPVMAALRKYRGLSKEIGTYGDAWATEWITKPCKEEGWLHPGDGRLHCIFNQYDAETGRSTSEKPNGQNLPKDKEVRSCFIVDDPDESIRISDCCDAGISTNGGITMVPTGAAALEEAWCSACRLRCSTHAEDYVMVTADMSGAELRILADLADDPVWIGAFLRGEDVHSVCTELIEAAMWPTLALSDCAYYQVNTDKDVTENSNRVLGALKRAKCKCPEHNSFRDGMKPTNFGIPYGISKYALAPQIGKSVDETAELMGKHKLTFPRIWEYVDNSGKRAKILKKSFDMFGRRRLFVDPTWEDAKQKAKKDREEKLRLDEDEQQRNVSNFIQIHGREPEGKLKEIDSEMWTLTHRLPTPKEIGNAYKSMFGSMERQGKNHEIQGTNATIAKLAMGAGYDPDGKPYLWHTLPQYKARLIKFVHDELVVHCPKRFGKEVAALIGDAFKRAAAEKMKKVVMEFDFNIATYWKK